MTSANLHQEFIDHPDTWYKYHEIAEENEQSFPELETPWVRICQELQKIKTNRTKVVVDMGCGKAKVAQHFHGDQRFTFINYDHLSSHDHVVACDISHTPLSDNSVEICILSLAMWGSNCHDYVREAHRILESDGKLYIIEPTKRWSNEDEQGEKKLDAQRLRSLLLETGFVLKQESIQKFCLFECIKV